MIYFKRTAGWWKAVIIISELILEYLWVIIDGLQPIITSEWINNKSGTAE